MGKDGTFIFVTVLRSGPRAYAQRCLACRFMHRPQFSDVPLKNNFYEADGILASIWAMTVLDGAPLQIEVVNGLLQVVRERIVTADRHRTRMALRDIQTLDDLAHIVDRNGTAAATVESKPAEWLDENGKYLRLDLHLVLFVCASRRLKLFARSRLLSRPHLRQGKHDRADRIRCLF
jgi:hypothetical protein